MDVDLRQPQIEGGGVDRLRTRALGRRAMHVDLPRRTHVVGSTRLGPPAGAPIASHARRSRSGGMPATVPLRPEHPPGIFARLCRMRLLPRACGAIA